MSDKLDILTKVDMAAEFAGPGTTMRGILSGASAEITRLRAELAESRKCVNALAGIADPEAFVSDVKTLLHAIDVAGIHPTTDVVALRNRIASMLPQENPNG